MTAQDAETRIGSYLEYLAIYFPNRHSSPLAHDNSPTEMGVQLAVESLDKHSECLRHAVQENELPIKNTQPTS